MNITTFKTEGGTLYLSAAPPQATTCELRMTGGTLIIVRRLHPARRLGLALRRLALTARDVLLCLERDWLGGNGR